MRRFICSKCHEKTDIKVGMGVWRRSCGDKDLYERWTHFQIMYEGKLVSEPYRILSIYRDATNSSFITVNAEEGSYPYCKVTDKDDILKVVAGYRCDGLLLLGGLNETNKNN